MRAVLPFLCALMAALASADAAVAAADTGTAAVAAPAPVGRIILKLRTNAEPLAASTASGSTSDAVIGALAARRQLALRSYRTLMPRLHVLSIASLATGDSLPAAIARLRADPAVEYAEPDERRHPLALPNDPLFAASANSSGQWYLQSPLATGAPSAIDAVDAWNISTGSSGVVIADVDTGVRFDHPDLLRAGASGRLLPGYTFISDETIANNFATWNADPSDPGDWIDQADQQNSQFASCAIADSSWHGTRVSGVLGALTNNSIGIAGVAWDGWVLPVRALGKCGGADSDIETAMLWAAGLDVSDRSHTVPLNPYPARVINLSLGASGNCPQSYQDVINTVSNMGVLVVVAAGNDGTMVEAPANCNDVVAVAGLREAGTKVGYSDLGPQITLGAPAGNCSALSGECQYTFETTTNLGTTTPELNSYTDGIDYAVGTSFSAPIVSGIAALMLSVNGNLTPEQLAARLREGARTPFPISSDPGVPLCHVPSGASDVQDSECSCTTSTCGAGMANADGAIDAALRPIAAVRVYGRVLAGQELRLDASPGAAACNHVIAAYAWSVTLPDGSSVSAGSGSGALVSVPLSGSVTVTLTVTDDAGRVDTAELTIGTASVTTAAPLAAGNSACLAPIAPVLPVTVAVSPSGPSVQAAIGAQQFAAMVSSSPNSAVEWQVNGIPGGNSTVGTISSAGLYLPPEEVPPNPVVTITAVAVADPNASGFAGATITAPVAIGIAPLSATLTVGTTQSFAATVSNSSSDAVIWSVNDVVGGNATVGTISNTGIYTAPARVPAQGMVAVTVVSAADPTRYALAYVTIVSGTQALDASAPSTGGGGALGLPTLGGLALAAWQLLCARRSKGTRPAPRRDKLGAWA